MNRFAEYFKIFLITNNFSINFISKKTGYSVSSIGHYLSSFRNPSYKFLNSFFKAFDIDKSEQFRIVKMVEMDKMPNELHSLKEDDTDTFSLVNKINSLSPDEKKQIEFFIDMFIRNR
ncbi:MAG: helix-turn-helix domain-containing protein [Fusobacteriaceae bacterium]